MLRNPHNSSENKRSLLVRLSCYLLLLGFMHSATAEESFADESYRKMNNSLQSSADWLDNIFLDKRSDEESASTRLIVRLDNELIEGEGVNNDVALRGKIVLPNLNRRIRLIFEGDPDSSDPTGLQQDENSTSAIRFLIRENLRNRLNFDIGGRGGLNNPRLFTRLQYRYQQDFGKTNLRYRPTIIWDTDRQWEGYLQFDVERRFKEKYFLRMSTIPSIRDTEPGWELEQNFTLYKDLGNDRYMAIEWMNDLKSEPDLRVDGSYLRFRFRREVWKKRLFMELGPGIRVVDDNDLRPQLDAYLRFELLFSNHKKPVKKTKEMNQGEQNSSTRNR